jgi:hypothetical protein
MGFVEGVKAPVSIDEWWEGGDWENVRVSELERSLRAIWPRCTPQVQER